MWHIYWHTSPINTLEVILAYFVIICEVAVAVGCILADIGKNVHMPM